MGKSQRVIGIDFQNDSLQGSILEVYVKALSSTLVFYDNLEIDLAIP